MPMDSVTTENVEHIMNEKKETQDELEYLTNMSIQRMWYSELGTLEHEYDKYKLYRMKLQSSEFNKKIAKKITTKKKVAPKKK